MLDAASPKFCLQDRPDTGGFRDLPLHYREHGVGEGHPLQFHLLIYLALILRSEEIKKPGATRPLPVKKLGSVRE